MATWIRRLAWSFVLLGGCSGAPGTTETSGPDIDAFDGISRVKTSGPPCTTAPLAGECRYAPTQAFASSIEGNSSAYVAENAIDGNCGSRWSSAFSDPQWLKVDLGSKRPLSRVVVHWENAASSSYQLQVSDDASTWTTVATKANATITGSGSTRIDAIAGLTASARYVRLYSLARTTSYGNSIFELEVFGTGCNASPSCSEIPVVPVGATASSQENTAKGPLKAIDGDSSSRWSSAFSDPQWLQLDLGQTRSLGKVSLDWENSASARYELQVSDSPTGPWTVIHTHQDSHVGPRTDNISALSGSGRYLRIYSTQRTTQFGISLFEVRVFRANCSGCEQVLVPTATATSSVESTAYAGSKAVDGDYTTRWSSLFSDPQWLRLDFGQARHINQVIIRWQNAASKSYRLEVGASSSGPWQVIAQRANQPAGPRWDFLDGLDATARFLRVYSTARTTSFGDSIIELIPLGTTLGQVCSGHGTCVEATPPGEKICDCNLVYSGVSCGTNTLPDGDGDGPDTLLDGCPIDPLKTEPLICGCNVSEVDSDGDKVPDCEDFCPNDPSNQIATPCGCAGQNNFQPAGSACIVEACSGSRQLAACSGQGQCGLPDCAPLDQGCFFRVFRDHGYWFCGGNVSWQQAETLCGDEPGRSLVQVNNDIEDQWLSSVLDGETWLGGNRLVEDENWAWSYNGSRSSTSFLVNGLPVPGRYSHWRAGAPGANQCLKLLDDGTWSDSNCAETHGFVCEQPVLRLPAPIEPPCPCDFFPGVSCDSCGVAPEPQGPCVEGSDVFPHTDGNPDKEPQNPDYVRVAQATQDCTDHCQDPADEHNAACVDHCQGFAAVPPLGESCDGYEPEEQAYCDLDPDTITGESCSVDTPCSAPYRCGRKYECAALDAAYQPQRCDASTPCPAGQYCGEHPQVCIDPSKHAKCDTFFLDGAGVKQCKGICFGSFACGIPNPECAVNETNLFKLSRCTTVNICPDANTVDINTNPLDDDESNLEPTEFPAASIFPVVPDKNPKPFQSADPELCGDPPKQPCDFDVGAHPWCNFNVDQDQTAARKADDQDPAFGNKHGTGGSKGPIRFDFDPNLDIGFHINRPLAMGDADFDAHANASATAGAHFSLFGVNGDVNILDAAAGLRVERCGISHDARLKLFGYDFLPALLDDAVYAQLSALDTPAAAKQTCTDTLGQIQGVVNRAQKALRDAQELIRQQKALVDQGKRFSPDLCHQLLEAGGGLPADFPSAAEPFQGCGNRTPEDTINLFIRYYKEQVAFLKTQLATLIPASVPNVPKVSIPFLGKIDPATGGGEVDEAHRETQQIANINFAIGPIPMNLTIEAFVQYGMAGALTFALTPGAVLDAYDSASAKPVAEVDASVTPFAGAGVSMFVGVGFSFPGLTAKLGISGDVSLGLVTLPIYAKAGINVKTENDQRPLPADMGGMLASTNMLLPKDKPAQKYLFEAEYKFGVSADIQNILLGSISAKLRIEFFWFSKTWQKQVAQFGPAIAPIHIPLINGGDGVEFADASGVLGFIHMPLTFVDFAELKEPDPLPPLGTGGSGGTGGTGGTGGSSSGGTATGGTGNRPPVSLLVQGDPRYQDVDYNRVQKLFYDGFCECNQAGPCSSSLQCCDGGFCGGSDFSPDKFCEACVQTRSPDGRGEYCEKTDQCCEKANGITGAMCRPDVVTRTKYCQMCTAEHERVIDDNGDYVADNGDCCGGLSVYRPGFFNANHVWQNAAGDPICDNCRATGVRESCNVTQDCCGWPEPHVQCFQHECVVVK